MTTYLHVNGAGDYIQTPELTFDKIVMDYGPIATGSGAYEYHVDTRMYGNAYLLSHGDGGVETWSSFTSVYKNGAPVSNGTNFIDTPSNTRFTLELDSDPQTTPIVFFSRYTYIQGLDCDVYDLKVYNAGTLVAHYDMSTGTVADQSGNSNDATLVGGTWMGASTGVPGSTLFDTQQSLYRQSTMSADLTQAIYESLSQSFDTQQQLYRSSTAQYDTEQTIYRIASRLFDTLQQITNNGVQGVARFDTRMVMYSEGSTTYDTQQALYERITSRYDLKQAIYRAGEAAGDVSIVIYADGSQQVDTRQSIYREGSSGFDTAQKLYDPAAELIGTIELDGQRTLYVYLAGQRNLTTHLKGVI